MSACTPITDARKNSTSVCTERAFSKKPHDVSEASRKLEPGIFESAIRHPLAQIMLRSAYQALSPGIVPLKCARSRDSNQDRSTTLKAASSASSKNALFKREKVSNVLEIRHHFETGCIGTANRHTFCVLPCNIWRRLCYSGCRRGTTQLQLLSQRFAQLLSHLGNL